MYSYIFFPALSSLFVQCQVLSSSCDFSFHPCDTAVTFQWAECKCFSEITNCHVFSESCFVLYSTSFHSKQRKIYPLEPFLQPPLTYEVLLSGASGTYISAGLRYFFRFWREKKNNEKIKIMKCFKYFQGGRFGILGVQDIMSLGDDHFVQRCGGISLGQW